ncbi:MAG: hypothetical protein K5985_07400 [Lachnospiraceae bacterium]|nr:hypothetical protein [Lachnospiraceae bacterium]
MRLWFREISNNRTVKELVINDETGDTRTHKVLHALDRACASFDLPHPIWLKANEREFARIARTRFRRDSFVEEINFDYLEIQVLEEDLFI